MIDYIESLESKLKADTFCEVSRVIYRCIHASETGSSQGIAADISIDAGCGEGEALQLGISFHG